MYYKKDYKTIFQDDSNEDFIILSHIVQKLWWTNHFWAKFKRPAKKYYHRRDTKAGFKRPRWRVKQLWKLYCLGAWCKQCLDVWYNKSYVLSKRQG
jgi:hypothetical protein